MGLPIDAGAMTEIPDQLTTAEYKLVRPGSYPYLTAKFIETRRAKNEDGTDVITIFGQPLNIPINRARSYEIGLDASNPNAAQRMSLMLFNIHFSTVRAVVPDTVVSDADLSAAIQALMAGGTTVDSFIAAEIESLEASRRIGEAPYVSVMGDEKLIESVTTAPPESPPLEP